MWVDLSSGRGIAQMATQWESELAHQDDVERHAERPGDFVGNGNAAARQAEDDD
jgi:hypothetical protein